MADGTDTAQNSMDPATVAALDALVPGAADFFQAQDNAAAMKLIQKAMDEYGNINLPQLKNLILQSLPPTELAKIQEDPQYRAQQAQADAQLNDVIQSGGMTLADKAALNGIRSKLNLDTTARNNAVTQQMAARGDLDSGAQLASQLSANQGADQQEAQFGENIAGQAQLRALQAIQQRGQNATANLSRKFDEDARVAAAKDAINAGNVAIANAANTYNTTVLPQRNFENQMQLAGAKAGADELGAGALGAQAKDQSQQNVQTHASNLVKTYSALKSPTGQGGGNVQGGTEPVNAGAPDSQALSGQSTKSGTTIGGDASGGGSSSGSGSGNTITMPDGSVLEYAGLDASGLPTYRRHATPGRNF